MRHTTAPKRFSPTLARRRLLMLAAAGALVGPARAAEFRELSWDDLVPKDWDPTQLLREAGAGGGGLSDGDPRAARMLTRLRDIWDSAPTVAALEGRKVKLPGYVVPLDEARDGLREFLLVPYFGACIHSPPPPANQIVRVLSQEAFKGLRTMSAVWVSGTLTLERSPSTMGVSGYALQARQVAPYKER